MLYAVAIGQEKNHKMWTQKCLLLALTLVRKERNEKQADTERSQHDAYKARQRSVTPIRYMRNHNYIADERLLAI